MPVVDQVYKFTYQLDLERKDKIEEDKSAVKATFMRNLSTKYDTELTSTSLEADQMKPIITYEEELKLENTKVSITDEGMSSDEDELTDDECFLERHSR